MLMAIPASISTLVNASLVNCEPWSVLKLSGLPCARRASSSSPRRIASAGRCRPVRQARGGCTKPALPTHRQAHAPGLSPNVQLDPATTHTHRLFPDFISTSPARPSSDRIRRTGAHRSPRWRPASAPAPYQTGSPRPRRSLASACRTCAGCTP
jgi:hypothetical protein